ncbi:equilibrative nucleoside transporter 4 [Condylostylus longicornis]|uniref:equilibrative nucleoside transporter 4 n=1 Tax=Condylostylus longicornis TaxID=2530218 RepID=UPI00244DCE7F|nr:equilibrative nucleoside transporter 4 [Condylostylus longicornis]
MMDVEGDGGGGGGDGIGHNGSNINASDRNTQATTYEPLDNNHRRNHHREPLDSPEMDSTSPPKDRKHMVYLALLTAGIGFVLPYNSFIIASDYWQERFPRHSVALDMSMTYIIVAFSTVLLNNVFLSLAPFRIRISFGYAISFTTLIFVAFGEVAWHVFSANTAYSANLAAVSLVAIGCTVQQSSFYGFASMLPKQYTQAVMAGESLAGFLVSSNRVVTKLLIQSDRVSTVIFFLTSTIYIGFSYVLLTVNMQSPFVRYHMKACAKIVLRPDEDRLNDTIDGDGSTAKYGVLSLDSSPPPKTESTTNVALSFSNPVYELSNPTAGESVLEGLNNLPELIPTQQPLQQQDTPSVAYKVEHILTPGQCGPSRLSDLKSGFQSRWRVAQAIYPYMVCIALAYCVTLSLYPGIESEIVSCNLGNWMPVLLMFAFNTSDVIGKLLAAVPYPWSRRQLILMSGLRIILVPLLLLCCTPRAQPVIAGEGAAFVFTIALGITNGLSGSLPMMLAPAKVPGTLKEVTGNIMTLSYNVGLTFGSLIGYVFESMLGPQIQSSELCKSLFFTTESSYVHNTTVLPVASSTSILTTTLLHNTITTPTQSTAAVATAALTSSASSTAAVTTSTFTTTVVTSLVTVLTSLASSTTNADLSGSSPITTPATINPVLPTSSFSNDTQDLFTNIIKTTVAASFGSESVSDFNDPN